MSDCQSSRDFKQATLLHNETVEEDVFELEFDWDGQPPDSGRFFFIRPIRSSVLLGRAISAYGWRPYKDNPTGRAGRLSFLIAARGKGTRELRELRVGERVEIIGPLGNSWEEGAPADFLANVTAERPLCLVGGGIGIAPIVYLASGLPERSYDLYAGFRSRPYGLEKARARRLTVATEDGCAGSRGRVLDFIDFSQYGAVYACGPEPMLRAVAAASAEAGIPALLSLERRMACGVGACLGCAVGTNSGNRRCCADGPIFDAREITFDD